MLQSKNNLFNFFQLFSRRSKKNFLQIERKFSTDLNKINQISSNFDVIIIGGGAIGMSTAFWIKRKLNNAKVLVIEKDLKYTTASTVLSAGGVRQQFSLKINVLLSLFGAEFIQNFQKYSCSKDEEIDFGFKQCGYLTLCSQEGFTILKENHENQRQWGAENQLLTPCEMKSKFPWLNVDGVALGCLGLKYEGSFDPWSYLTTLAAETKKLGTQFIEGQPIEFCWKKLNDCTREIKSIVIRKTNGEIEKVNCSKCILAAGAHTGSIAKELLNLDKRESGLLQYEIPIEPRKRFIYCYENPDLESNTHVPMVIDPTGVYVRREGNANKYICGCSPGCNEEEPDIKDLEVDYEYFTDKIWPILSFRIPCFEKLRLKSAWAGYYEYNEFDKNGIVGYHPAYSNLIIASGFSGHGLQHSPGVGNAVSELLIDGCYKTIDLTPLNFERIMENKPLIEREII